MVNCLNGHCSWDTGHVFFLTIIETSTTGEVIHFPVMLSCIHSQEMEGIVSIDTEKNSTSKKMLWSSQQDDKP